MAADRGPSTPSPASPSADSDLAGLLEEYTERLRRGETPSIEEYVARRPDLGADIRDLFPAMAAIEGLGGAAAREPEAPRQVGEFRIVREIGRGGMGVVYEAVQESLGRRVALKVLPQDFLRDAKGVERFRREARAAARLHHTSIVPVFGVGEEGGLHYYAMQLIQGRGLDQLIGAARCGRTSRSELLPGLDAPQPWDSGSGQAAVAPARSSTTTPHHHRAAALIALRVAEALRYAHSQGVLHRDIKPSNLLVDGAGAVWVTDFGLAKSEDDGSGASELTLTHPGDIVGTIAYLAPERLEGRCDARSDIYALGLTLYELVTLEPAFADENRRRLLRKVAEDTPLSPARHDPSIPRDLETIILTAIARDPARRYGSAAELASDLRCFLDGRPISARRATTLERARGWCRREPALATLGGLIVLLLATIATLSSIGYVRVRDLLRVTESSLERAREAEGRVHDELRRAQIAQAHASRVGGQPGRRSECLTAVRRAVELDPTPSERSVLRSEAIAALALTDLRIVHRWRREPRMAFALSPDLETYAEASPDGDGIVVREILRGVEIARIPLPGIATGSLRYSWSADLLVARPTSPERGVVVVEIASGETRFESASRPSLLGCDLQRGSRLLAFVTPGEGVHLVDLASGRLLAVHPGPGGQEHLAFHPHLDRVGLASTTNGHVHVLDPRSGEAIASADAGVRHTTLTWSPDGSLLAAARTNGAVSIWEFREGRLWPRASLDRVRAWLVTTVFDETSRLLAVHGWDSALRIWDAPSAQLLLTADGAPAVSSRDGRMGLVLGTYEAAIAELETSEVCSLIPRDEKTGGPFRIEVRRDGRWLALARGSGLTLFDPEQRRFLPSPPLPRCESALFSPDGEWLLTGGPTGLERWRIPTSLGGHATARTEPDDGRADSESTWSSELIHEVSGDSSRWIAQSADGRTLAIPGEKESQEIVVLRSAAGGWTRTRLGPHRNVDRISLRPDGRRLASGTWLGEDVIVWDTESGAVVQTFPIRDNAFVEYSPDGRWLAVMTPEACFVHDAETLDRIARVEKPAHGGFPGFAAFRDDGAVLAISYGRSSIRLVDPASGEEIATLEAPGPVAGSLAFGPGGTHLYAALPTGAAWDWNLTALRRELRTRGLDWREPTR